MKILAITGPLVLALCCAVGMSTAATPPPARTPAPVLPPAFIPAPAPVPVQKATLKHAELNQTSFAAPGNLTIAAMLTGDKGSSTNCNFIANIWTVADGADAINVAVVSGVKLTGSLPGLVGPVPANLQHGKYRVEFAVDNEASSACKGSTSANFEVKRQTLAVGAPVVPAKILNVTPDEPSFGINSALKFYVLAESASKCAKLTLSIDDKSMDLAHLSFPATVDIKHTDSVYPKAGGKHTITVSGAAPDCKGSASAVFGTKVEPPPKVEPPQIGTFNNFALVGMPNANASHYMAGHPLEMNISGTGTCQLDIALKSEKGGTMYTRRVTAKFPFHYVGEYTLPPYGHMSNGRLLPFGTDDKNQEKSNDEGLSVTVTPVNSSNPTQVCVGQPKFIDFKTKCMDAVCQPSGQNNSGSDAKDKVTGLKVTGFTPGKADGKIELNGTGVCDVRVTVFNLATAQAPDLITINKEITKITFPLTRDKLGPLADGAYRAYALTGSYSQCVVKGPDASAKGWYVDFKVGTGTGPGSTSSGDGSGTGSVSPPGGYVPPAPKAANGNITSMQVPGGSFAEDEAQKIQVMGTGGCAMDLHIWNTAYGGNFDKTFDVKAMALAGSPMLYNGTHFDTLAEGSYSAAVKGKGSCTGNAAIDFKVTAKTSTADVKGKPTLSVDKPPQSGGAFSKTKDSNIWFKVSLPPSIKGTQYATCCDVEFNFKNSFGGWEVLPGSPFSDSSWANTMTLPSVAVPQSVSGFKQGSEWRMKVRAAKFKTTFEWSDWLEFKVDQN